MTHEKLAFNLDLNSQTLMHCSGNELFLRPGLTFESVIGLRMENAFNNVVSDYIKAYFSFLKTEHFALSPPELIQINHNFFMIEAYSTHDTCTDNHPYLRIYLNDIAVDSSILALLGKPELLEEEALKIQLDAAYQQVSLILDDSKKKTAAHSVNQEHMR